MPEVSAVEVATSDGVMRVWLAKPRDAQPQSAVILFMDGLGVRPTLIDMAQRLAADLGRVAILPDLYYRHGQIEPIDVSKAFVEGPEQQRMLGYFQSVTVQRVLADTQALISHLDSTGYAGVPIGAVGYCMGGAHALAAAGTFAKRIDVAASFHGGSLVTDAQDSPHRLCAHAKARLYIGLAGIDPYFSAESTGALAHGLYGAGVNFTMQSYPGVYHGFAIADTPAFNHAAAEKHWAAIGDLFAQR